MARVFDRGSTYRVSLGPDALARFRSRYPASGLDSLSRVSFDFEKRNGDLVDNRCNGRRSCASFDGEALKILSQDAQCIGEKRLRPRPEHAPRCQGGDWRQLGKGRPRALAGAAAKAHASPEHCRTGLSKCMKSNATVTQGGKKAAAAICMRDFNRCRR